MNKELEEAIDNLLMLKYFLNEEKEENYREYTKAIETVLNHIDNSIPKEKVEKKIEILKMEERYDYIDNKKAITALQELLKGE